MSLSHNGGIILASTSNGAGTSTNATEVNNTTPTGGAGLGGRIIGKCTNGVTGPTVPCQMNIYLGYATGVKNLVQILVFDPGNNAVSVRTFYIEPGDNFVNVTFTGNTDQAVTVYCEYSQLAGQ